MLGLETSAEADRVVENAEGDRTSLLALRGSEAQAGGTAAWPEFSLLLTSKQRPRGGWREAKDKEGSKGVCGLRTIAGCNVGASP